MHLKIHRGFHNAVLGYCMEFRNREVLLLCNASNHVTEQMMTVDTTDADTDGEKELFVLLEIHSYNGIALLGCLTDSGEAVALVERNLSLCILETDASSPGNGWQQEQRLYSIFGRSVKKLPKLRFAL